jgi:hypothetical protein
MTKFNSFDVIYERAFSKYANGGAFRENTPIKIKDAYFSSPYFKSRYAGDPVFTEWLKGLVKQGIFFFIHKINANDTTGDSYNVTDFAGALSLSLTVKTDPRTISFPTEFNEFNVPADFKFIEVLDFGPNLPPVQGVPNKYERPLTDYKAVEAKTINIANQQPKDNSLPRKNTKIKS